MTDHPEYTLTQPPSGPRKWDHLKQLNLRFRQVFEARWNSSPETTDSAEETGAYLRIVS